MIMRRLYLRLISFQVFMLHYFSCPAVFTVSLRAYALVVYALMVIGERLVMQDVILTMLKYN